MGRPRLPFSKLKRASVWTRNAREDGLEGKMNGRVRHHTGSGNATKIISRADHNRVHKRALRKRAIKKNLAR